MTYFDALNQGTWSCQVPCSCILRNFFLPVMIFSSGNFSIYKIHLLDELSLLKSQKLLEKNLQMSTNPFPNLTENGLLQYRTIELNGEIELIFDASLAFERLDSLLDSQTPVATAPNPQNQLKDLLRLSSRN